METFLEQQRRYHEERERLMDGMVQVWYCFCFIFYLYSYFWSYFYFCSCLTYIFLQERLYIKTNRRDGVNSEHRQRFMLEKWGSPTISLVIHVSCFISCFSYISYFSR